ncbi:C1q-like adipose specific protein-like protein [Daphnia sinensis]|uniref:C1q-like adipose specific protein-like protein n=1 Tax=Daphnia sinensis TaxID=1820382 RepID=A0AAD5KZ93_9CRUS|nr:C1q-like adipose specific protein-like protein [Daphnia sinensis]
MGRFPAILFGLVVLVCLTAGLTVEEQLEHLKEIYVRNQQVLEAQVTRLEAEMIEMKAKVARTEALERQINQQASLLNALQAGNRNSAAKVALPDGRKTQRDWNSTLNRATTGPSGIQYPTCCADLYSMGHTLSGVYSVIGSKSVETVFCDFFKAQNQQGFQTFQKWIGYADVKSLPTYFYVQRNSNFNTVGVPIPFQLAKTFTRHCKLSHPFEPTNIPMSIECFGIQS